MRFYKLIFSKGYHFSVRKSLANSPENAANHMHYFMTILIGLNILSALAFILMLLLGEKQALGFLTNGVTWAIVLAFTYGFVYYYFISNKKYIFIVKNFYKTSKFKGRNGTLLSVLFFFGSFLLLFSIVFYLARDKYI